MRFPDLLLCCKCLTKLNAMLNCIFIIKGPFIPLPFIIHVQMVRFMSVLFYLTKRDCVF